MQAPLLCLDTLPLQGHASTGSGKLIEARKGMDTRILLTALAGSLILAGCSSYGDLVSNNDYGSRFYVGAGALISQLEPDTDGVDGVSVEDSDSAGFSLTAGIDISQNFSLEAHLADLGEASLAPAGSVSYQVGGLSALVYGFNRVKDRRERIGLSLFGRLGVGGLENDAEVVRYEQVNSAHMLFGAGVEYGFDNGLAARAEVMAHESDARFAQLGLIYRFGSYSDQGRTRTPRVPEPEVAATTQGAPLSQAEVLDNDPQALPTPVVPADADLDGVPDTVDRCPDTGSGLPVREDGCEVFNGVIEGVQFETGSDELTAEAVTVMADVAQTLRDYPDVKVTVEAHTDNRGSALENLQLSRRRAISVARFLVEQGISGSRLKPQAYGESRPRETNRTEEGRAANRRVEFSVFE